MGWKPFSRFRVFGRAMKTNARARPARWQYPYPPKPRDRPNWQGCGRQRIIALDALAQGNIYRKTSQ
jgi:hypothetical protein